MPVVKFTNKEIEAAYLKLKSYVYHDSYSLFLREKISHFERENIQSSLKRLTIELNNQIKDNKLVDYISAKISTIQINLLPKKVVDNKSEDLNDDGINLISNRSYDSDFVAEKCIFLIDTDVEIHIIATLWVMRYGVLLTKDASNAYAYSIWTDEENDNQVISGLRLFHPYFSQYQKWRDKAISSVKQQFANSSDVVLVSLDIKNYFHSVDFSFDELGTAFKNILKKPQIPNDLRALNLILSSIHKKYRVKLNSYLNENTTNPLPIGLLSSGVLANWYLQSFDEKVISSLSPAYYGRYVDDILIVLSNCKIEVEQNTNLIQARDNFIDQYFVKRGLLEKSKKNESNNLILSTRKSLSIQKEKVVIFDFDKNGSDSLLKNFEKKIKENSSAFWFLPEEESTNNEFDDDANVLIYSDSHNKLRSISALQASKYGASVFLAKKIKSALMVTGDNNLESSKQILLYFSNKRNLEFYSLWEKVATYFLVMNQKEYLWKFYVEVIKCIDKIVIDNNSEINSNALYKLKNNLIKFFELCLSMALTLKPRFLNSEWITRVNYSSLPLKIDLDKIYSVVKVLRVANMMRHHYVFQPLLNYTNLSNRSDSEIIKSVLDLSSECNHDDLDLNDNSIRYSPRYVHMHEIDIWNNYQQLIMSNNDFIRNADSRLNFKFDGFQIINDRSEELFNKFNRLHVTGRNDIFLLAVNSKNIEEKTDRNPVLKEDVVVGERKFDKIKVLVANHHVDYSDILKSIVGNVNKSKKKREKIFRLLNDSERLKGDLLVLPENSYPDIWLRPLVEESRNKQRVIIVGLEHINLHGVVYNIVVTILPYKRDKVLDARVVFRLKNHYSPFEKFQIEQRGFVVPEFFPKRYHRFVWNSIAFSVYNCYELADIHHRALFKTEIDLMIAVEYNKDVSYFSNIVESVTRDLHCYFIQVNSSDYGDSRVTAPVKSQLMNLVRLKGGDNSVILKATLDISKLREFQKLGYGLQKEDESLKPTPPNFNRKFK